MISSFSMQRKSRLYQQQPLIGGKMCSDICLWTLPILRREQFSQSEAWGEMQNEIISADKYSSMYFHAKWSVLSLTYFSQFLFLFMCRFENWGIKLIQIFLSFCCHIWSNTMLETYLMDYKQLLDKIFVITRIIKIEVGVMIMLSETLIILKITKTKSNNCFIIRCTEKIEVMFLLLH